MQLGSHIPSLHLYTDLQMSKQKRPFHSFAPSLIHPLTNMKLRLEDHTLRLRLDPPEVAAFQQHGRLQTVVPLGLAAGEQLTYTLERDATVPKLSVRHAAGCIRVLLPAAVADAWTSTGEVSLRGEIEVVDNQVLSILVEKDLGCQH